MNERELDNYMRGKFRDAEETFLIKDRLWDEVVHRLDADQPKRRQLQIMGWLPLMVLGCLMLMSNAWWANALNKTKTEVDLLKHQMEGKSNVAQNLVTSTVIRDTVYKTIYRTVHEIRYIHEKQPTSSGLPQVPTQNAFLQQPVTSSAKGDLANRILTNQDPTTPPNVSIATDVLTAANATTDNDAEANSATNATSLPVKEVTHLVDLLPTLKPSLLQIKRQVTNTPIIGKQKVEEDFALVAVPKEPFSIKKAVTPSGYSIEAVSNYLLAVHNGITSTSGGQYGMNMEFGFGKHLRVLGGASGAKVLYRFSPSDSLFGVPQLPSPAIGFVLDELEANNVLYQTQVGLKYVFTDWLIKPYLSTTYTTQWAGKLIAKYSFQNADGEEIVLYQEPVDKINLSHYLTFGTGFGYDISKHWSAKVYSNYQVPLKNKVELPSFLSLGAGVVYRF